MTVLSFIQFAYELFMLEQNLMGLVISMITESLSLQKISDIMSPSINPALPSHHKNPVPKCHIYMTLKYL